MVVIEEVARADVAASLIPAVNKLGSFPVQIGGSEELKSTYLTKLAAGKGGFSYCLSARGRIGCGQTEDHRGA